jgi:DNA-binding NarL/FixJ family response regulator
MARAGLRAVLEEAGVGVAGEGGGRSPELAGADVVLVAGEEILEEVSEEISRDGSQALLVLTDDERVAVSLRALPVRGWGFLPPDAAPDELEAAIVAVGAGLVVLPREASGPTLRSLDGAGEDLDEPLTNREREVLALLSRGLSNRLIARELHISEHTVKFHIASLYAKLGVSSRAGAVGEGMRYGLLSP